MSEERITESDILKMAHETVDIDGKLSLLAFDLLRLIGDFGEKDGNGNKRTPTIGLIGENSQDSGVIIAMHDRFKDTYSIRVLLRREQAVTVLVEYNKDGKPVNSKGNRPEAEEIEKLLSIAGWIKGRYEAPPGSTEKSL